MKIKKNYFWLMAGILIVGGAYYWFSQSKLDSASVKYLSAQVKRGNLEVSVTGTGEVEAVNQVDLKPVVAGDAIDVQAVYVKNDQAVEKGDLIALLDPEDAQKAVRNAELDLKSAKNKYNQTKNESASDRFDKKSQEIVVKQKENALSDAKSNLADYYIRAPFSGIVTNLSVSAGDSVSRSDVLASIITKDLQAEVILNEVDAVQVKTGGKAILKFDALPEFSLLGTVAKIDTLGIVSQGVVSYNAEIVFEKQNERLRPGMSVSASIISENKSNVLMAPISAIKSDARGSYVEILKNGRPERKEVQVGVSNGEFSEISGDIQEGKAVITQTIKASADEMSNSPNASSSNRGISGGAFRAFH